MKQAITTNTRNPLLNRQRQRYRQLMEKLEDAYADMQDYICDDGDWTAVMELQGDFEELIDNVKLFTRLHFGPSVAR